MGIAAFRVFGVGIGGMDCIRILVEGEPVAKGRPRFSTRGKFARAYTPEKTRSYEARIFAAAKTAYGELPPVSGPLAITITVKRGVPASWSRSKRSAALAGAIKPTTKPDWDNHAKVTDALNGLVWVDDAQITHATVVKQYASDPGLLIEVRSA